MKCNSCGTNNTDGAVYCDACGTSLENTSVTFRSSIAGDPPASPVVERNQEVENSSLKLRVIKGGGSGRVFKLEQGTNLIGRWDADAGSFPEIDLENDDIEAKVSRKHAVIECRGSQVFVRDIGSLNGTFINRGPRLEQGKDNPLNIGDEIIVGKTFLKLEK